MHGLTDAQVAAARAQFGPNKITKRKKTSIVRVFFANFSDPMLKILLIALGINCIFIFQSQNFLETFGIALAVLIAVVVSTISEQTSSAAFERLQRVAAEISVRCMRSGAATEIKIEDVVVGDIIILGPGDKIPADGVLISGQIEVGQSLLNGESKEAQKLAAPTWGGSGGVTPHDFLHPNLLFSGTVVTNGIGQMRVTSVGDATFFGKMAAELQTAPVKSPLKEKLEKLAKVISIIGYIGAALIAGAYLISTLAIHGETFSFHHVIYAATLVVSVIVMAVPEGLPMMITVVLASNMKHMMRDNVLVRKLNGIETAGSMNILFTDKTGTLTMGKMEVAQITGDPRTMGTILRYNNSAQLDTTSGGTRGGVGGNAPHAIGGNFTDRILLEYSQKLPYEECEIATQIPFNSRDKFMQTTLADGRILLKGAPEVVLAKCAGYDKAAITRQVTQLTEKAFRLIACSIDNKFVGLVAIRDTVRPEAIKAVKSLQSASIQTVMITGDARETAVAVAREVGIFGGAEKGDLVLTSAELSELSDEQLAQLLPNLRVVARALPTDKSRLVRVAQSLGLVVGMTGDGVNDAPALKSADVGFAMGSGTEVAKDAGDVVIMDDNITSIAKSTSYGRTIFKSIRKYLIFKLTINFVAMGISILAPFLGTGMPITVLQMLWINIVMDTLAGLAYGGERPRKSYMSEPPKRRSEHIINNYMWGQIIFASIYIGIMSLWFLTSNFVQGLFLGHTTIYAMTAFFAFFMFINIFNAFNSRTHDINLTSYMSLNKPFAYIMSIVAVAQVLLIFFGGQIFRTEPLSIRHLLIVIALALTILPIDIMRKVYIKFRHKANNPGAYT